MERAKQQQQQPSQSSGQSTAAPTPSSKPLSVNGASGAATKDSMTTNKDIKSPHRSVHDNSTYIASKVKYKVKYTSICIAHRRNYL